MQNWGKEGGDEMCDSVPTSIEISFRLATISNYSRTTPKCDSETELTSPLIFPTNWLILKKSGKTNKVRSYIYFGQAPSFLEQSKLQRDPKHEIWDQQQCSGGGGLVNGPSKKKPTNIVLSQKVPLMNELNYEAITQFHLHCRHDICPKFYTARFSG